MSVNIPYYVMLLTCAYNDCHFRSSESMPLKSIGDGTYVANWVPSVGGNYLIQIFIDGCRTGKKYDTPQFSP